MATHIVKAFYLGVGGDIDPDESNFNTENANAWVGATFGSAGAPLVDNNMVDLSLNDANNDGAVRENDTGQAAETIGSVHGTSILDSTNEYFVTLTYTDGSTATTAIVLLQDTAGRVYLTSFNTGNAFNDELNAAPIRSVRLDSVRAANYGGVVADDRTDGFVTCFLRGTRIRVPGGTRAVEDLKAGDPVCTCDAGARPVRAISFERRRACGAAAPVVISRGALGHGLPQRALRVSRQHRILLRTPVAKRMFADAEVLLPAVALCGLPGVSLCDGDGDADYFHILLDAHHLIWAEGALAETLYIGPMVQRLNRALPAALAMTPVRPFVAGRRARRLVARLCKNGRAAQDHPPVQV